MVDFVEEVEEQLRAERYAGFARRALPWFLAALAATVVGWLGVWGYHTWQARNIDAASITYDKALTAMASGDLTGAYTAFQPLAASGPPAYRALALMQQANIRLAAGKDGDAAALFDKAAAADRAPIFRDLARLRAAQTLMDSRPLPEIQTRLQPLIGENRPYDLQAREALAMAKLAAGRTQEARGDFNALAITLGAPQSMRGRAQAAIAMIDSGQAAAVGPAVRAAATMPPSGPATFGPPDNAGGSDAGAGAASAPAESPPAQP
ncbi:MAG: tetratricopeptide repeat protein [Caulobacteraceae bacterium]|nr:tetratricopeptide repeat protein [Caulobacteraceae bacterium]